LVRNLFGVGGEQYKLETVGKKVAMVPFKIPYGVLIRDYFYTLPPKKQNIYVKLTIEMTKKYAEHKKFEITGKQGKGEHEEYSVKSFHNRTDNQIFNSPHNK
jgi:hypothetical protein